jgi:flagellar assembly protein FliH
MKLGLNLPDLNRPKIAPPPPPPAPELIAAIRAEGAAEGFARGLAQGRTEGAAEMAGSLEADAARALAAIAQALDSAAEAGRMAAEESARALASLLFATADLVMARTVERDAPALIAGVMTPLLGALADRPEAELRVAPALVAAVAARLPAGAPPVLGDPQIAPGDAAMRWQGGGRIIALAQRRAAVRDALRESGFDIEGMEQDP